MLLSTGMHNFTVPANMQPENNPGGNWISGVLQEANSCHFCSCESECGCIISSPIVYVYFFFLTVTS